MKIRNGFVSNSSSSSFCIIGVEGNWASKLLAAELHNGAPRTRPNHGSDCECSKCLAFRAWESGELPEDLDFGYGHYCPGDRKLLLEYYGNGGESVTAAGFEAAGILEDSTLKDAKKAFKMAIKTKLDLDVPLAVIGLRYGRVSNE